MLSIIIATYNAGDVLERALKSVVSQQYRDFECIIVDGQSNDATMDIALLYARNDNRLSVFSEKDNGIFDALNKGVKQAKGEWIYVLGADDEILSTGLKDLMDVSPGFDVVYGHTIDRYENGKLRYPKSKDYMLVKRNMFCSHQGLIMRRELILGLNGFNTDYALKADFDLVQRAYLGGARFRKVDVNVAVFSMDGVSSKASILQEKERYRILKANKSISFPLFYIVFLAAKKALKKLYLHFIKRL